MLKGNLFTTISFVIVATLASCSGGKEQKKEIIEKPFAVASAIASQGPENIILASGRVEAIQTVNLSTRVMGRITNIYGKAGDKVHQGQLLVTISDDDIRAKRAQTDAMIAEAEAAWATAQKDYNRFNNLYKQQSATVKELDNVTLQFNSAKARVDAARQMRSEVNAALSYSSLTAPFSGVVTQKLAEVGSMANPGMPILTIEQNGVLQISASIAESDISNIHLGDVATVQIKSPGKNFEGKIIQLNPSSQFTGGQYIVKISIPENVKKDIYAGMFANVNITTKEIGQPKNNALLVPVSAIINRDELTGIYTVSTKNTALLRWIRLGKTYGDKVEVISGLSKDERFICSSESKLYNGAPVVLKAIPEVSMTAIGKSNL